MFAIYIAVLLAISFVWSLISLRKRLIGTSGKKKTHRGKEVVLFAKKR